MNKFFNRKSITITWFVTYILIFLLPITLFTFIYINMDSMIENEIKVSNEAVFNHLSNNIEDIIADIENLNVELILNPDIKRIASLSGQITANDRYNLFRTVDEFKNYKLLDKKIIEFYIYFPKINTILTSNSVTDPETFFYGHYGINNNIEPWLDNTNAIHSHQYYMSPEDNNLIFANSLFLDSRTDQADANIFIVIDKQIINIDIDKADFLRGGASFIVDSSNQLLYYFGDEKYKEYANTFSNNDDSQFQEKRIDDEIVTVIYNHISPANWDYVSIIPASSFWNSIRTIRHSSYVMMAVCLIFGLILAFLLTRYNYAPVSKLITALKPYNNNNNNNGNNEYNIINSIVEQILIESSENHNVIHNQNIMIKQYILEQLIRVDNFDMLSVDLEKYDISFISNYFVVGTLFISDDFHGKENNTHSFEHKTAQEFIEILYYNTFEKLAKEIGLLYPTIVNGVPVILINIFKNKVDTWKEKLKEIESDITSIVSRYFGINATLMISSLQDSITKISFAYHQSVSSSMLQSNSGISMLFYDDINISSELNNDIPTLAQLYKLRTYLNSGDYESSSKHIDETIDAIVNTYGTHSLKKVMLNNLYATIIMIINEFNLDIESSLVDEILVFSDTDSNPNNIRKNLNSIIKIVCEANLQNKSVAIKEKINNYIITNYSDPELSVTSEFEELIITSLTPIMLPVLSATVIISAVMLSTSIPVPTFKSSKALPFN